MGAFSDIFERAQQWAAWEPPTETRAIPTDRFDDMVLSETVAATPVVSDYRDKLSDTIALADEFVKDLGALFYTQNPEVRPQSEMDPRASRSIIEAASKLPVTESLRELTVMDRYATAQAVGAIAESLEPFMSAMEESRELSEDRMIEMERQRDTLREALEDGDEYLITASTEILDEYVKRQALEDEEARAQAASAMRHYAEQALNTLKADAENAAGWGVSPGELQRMNFEERAKLASELRNNRITKFVNLIGRMRTMSLSERARKAEFAREEAYTVMLGDNLSEALPSELVALADPLLSEEATERLMEGRLLQRKWRGTQRKGEGPIVVLIDTSGSMAGDPEAWSKALALAFMRAAREQNRPFATILYASRDQQALIVGSGLPQAIQVGQVFWGGGTEWEAPLTMALDFICGHAEFEHADLVHITDGQCLVRDEFLADYDRARLARGIRAWGINLSGNCALDRVHPSDCNQSLERLSDDTRTISDFTDVTSVADMMHTI